MRATPLRRHHSRTIGDEILSGTYSRAVEHWSSSLDRFVVISGCSSGGKSTLIAELGKRGYAVVDEPGRRIVKEELTRGGAGLPWVDGVGFPRRVLDSRALAAPASLP